jgi:segregation and condensation protein B
MDDERARQPLGLDAFAEPDDQGLSLDELSQAYAAILNRGADPYQQVGQSSALSYEETNALSAEEPATATQADDQANCAISPRSILEAMLFVGHPTGEPLLSERIAALMRGVRPAEIDDLVQELNDQYQREGAPYAIVSVSAGYQLALRSQFASLRDAFYGRIREARLSQAAVDVLAIIAYHQPLSQEAIERFRGKASGGILAQLVRRDLVSLVRSPGQPPAYRTTDRFLDLFGLDELSELPRSQELERNL